MFFFFRGAWLLSQDDLQRLSNGGASLRWPHVQGTIKSSKVYATERWSKYQSYFVYQCLVNYEYMVGKKQFEGSQISYASEADHPNTSKEFAESVQSHFKVGSHHKVYFDSRNPKKTVLIPGVDPNNFHWNSFELMVLGGFSVSMLGAAIFSRYGSGLDNSTNRFSAIAMASALLCCFAYASQPAVVRQIVPNSAIVHQQSFLKSAANTPRLEKRLLR
ncbi:MAG: DUF3592 domain-containing protein [Candidatus Obscuribacterales bacterium]|nr:DUF3592 domain-containing protein [Candidatus Obscuribacterales bacterium]